MKKEHLKILKRLMNHYHTLPLEKKELKPLCQKIGIDPSLTYEVLKSALKEKIFPSVTFMQRTLIYLTPEGKSLFKKLNFKESTK